jgi:hypothetical protein
LVEPFIPVQTPDKATKPITCLIRFINSREWMLTHANSYRVTSWELLPSLSIKRNPCITSCILWYLVKIRHISKMLQIRRFKTKIGTLKFCGPNLQIGKIHWTICVICILLYKVSIKFLNFISLPADGTTLIFDCCNRKAYSLSFLSTFLYLW